MTDDSRSPLFDHDPSEEPVFLPKNLLDGARRQKGLARSIVPAGCLLDFDGELVDHLVRSGAADADRSWPCFHTRLFRWKTTEGEYGIIGGTVGAPFAVLVAEELFASGCRALVSIASAGLIAEGVSPPFFLLIERALRDEGTSHHYRPPGRYADADPSLVDAAWRRLKRGVLPVLRGASWTTDAPFRETDRLIASRRSEGIVSVEMEAAALLAMASALRKPVVCFAHVTNAMATRGEDFDKGGDAGQEDALTVCALALDAALAHAGTRGAGPGIRGAGT